MTIEFMCKSCDSRIYWCEFSENEFSVLPKEQVKNLEQLLYAEPYLDTLGYEVGPLDEGIDYVFVKPPFFFKRCPSCQMFYLYGKTFDDYVESFELESKMSLPMIGTAEDQLMVKFGREYEEIAKSYIKNTPLEPISVSCDCQCCHKDFLDFDYLVFSICLIATLSELKSSEDFVFEPDNRLEFMLKFAYQAYVCEGCKRITIVGKDMHNSQFKAVYKPFVIPPKPTKTKSMFQKILDKFF